METPIGVVRLLFRGEFLCRIALPGLEGGEGRETWVGRGGFPGREAARIARALSAWFEGEEGPLRSLPFLLQGTPLFRRVWEEVKRIPRGETRSYKDVSLSAFASPRYARTVGAALRANPLPLLVPCHRVLGSDGKLKGFGGSSSRGLGLKRKLLALEGIECDPP